MKAVIDNINKYGCVPVKIYKNKEEAGSNPAWCYRLNVVSPTKFTRWNRIPNMMVFGDEVLEKWLGHKGKKLSWKVRVLVKETPESSFTPSTKWGQSKKTAIYEPGGRPSRDTESTSLDFWPATL